MNYKGLLYKDLFLIKDSFPIVALAALILFFTIFLGFPGGFLAICIMLLAFAVKISESTLIYDENDEWESFVLTAPVSRKEIVRSKYLLQTLLLAGAFLITFGIFLLISVFIPQITGKEWLFLMLIVGFCCALIYGAIIIPIYMKFGVHKSRYISFVILVIIAGLYGTVFGFSVFLEFAASTIPLLIGVLVLSLAAYGVSYSISRKIYAKREF